MSSMPPLVVVVAGPNGAGKSTTAPLLLQGALAVGEFVNADTIAQGLSAFRPASVGLPAGRVMLARLRSLARARATFAFETTLASRSFAPWLASIRASGYRVHIAFLSLPSAELALARVSESVQLGGHDVAENVVRRRFHAGLRNFFTLYESVADSWRMFDNSHLSGPILIASGRAEQPPEIVDAIACGKPCGGVEIMEVTDKKSPVERIEDVPRILRAMTRAVREALVRHKQAANPVAVWRNGAVEWVKPEDIPTDCGESE